MRVNASSARSVRRQNANLRVALGSNGYTASLSSDIAERSPRREPRSFSNNAVLLARAAALRWLICLSQVGWYSYFAIAHLAAVGELLVVSSPMQLTPEAPRLPSPRALRHAAEIILGAMQVQSGESRV